MVKVRLHKDDYLELINAGWGGIEAYDYQRNDTEIHIMPDGQSGLSYSTITENLVQNGTKMTSLFREYATYSWKMAGRSSHRSVATPWLATQRRIDGYGCSNHHGGLLLWMRQSFRLLLQAMQDRLHAALQPGHARRPRLDPRDILLATCLQARP